MSDCTCGVAVAVVPRGGLFEPPAAVLDLGAKETDQQQRLRSQPVRQIAGRYLHYSVEKGC